MRNRTHNEDVVGLYKRLNAIRAKHKISLLPTPSFVDGQKILASDVTNIKNQIGDTGNRSSYLPAINQTIEDVSVGDIILEKTLDEINSALENYEAKCYHRSSYYGSCHYYDGSYYHSCYHNYGSNHHSGNYSYHSCYVNYGSNHYASSWHQNCYGYHNAYNGSSYNGSNHRVDFDRN